MHGLDLSLILGLRLDAKLAQARGQLGGMRFAAEPAAAAIAPTKGMRNLFRPGPEHLFSAGGLVAMAADGHDAPLRQLMRNLAMRVQRVESWPDSLAPPNSNIENFENPSIPSGYTYLLQLMAHDLVNSAVSLAGTGISGFGFANTRLSPLSLETVYGGGPSVCPHAYEYDRGHRQFPGGIPRSRLRVGRSRNKAGSTDGCPFRDIARAIPAATRDDGLDPGEQLDLGPSGSPKRPWWTEALLADSRNDDHALLSQLTLLFHVLHNHLIGRLASPQPEAVDVFRHFICTRFVVTLIYRAIIVRDVLRRILHPDVYRRYVLERKPLLEDLPKYEGLGDGIPREFSHGAYRFGHGMVRTSYRVNSDDPLDFVQAMAQSSRRGPNNVPVNELWLVDWSRFFNVGDSRPNLSRRIGPNFSPVLMNTAAFPALSKSDGPGLANRDMLSAAYAGLWSVRALSAELRSLPGIAAIVPEFEIWRRPLSDWLGRPPATLSGDDIGILADDPPLPFFVMFEAAHPLVGGVPTPRGGGQCLGPVGSIIVAETILGAINRNAIGFERDGDTLREKIRSVCAAVLDNPDAFDAIPEISSMPDLLRFMRGGGAISLPAAG